MRLLMNRNAESRLLLLKKIFISFTVLLAAVSCSTSARPDSGMPVKDRATYSEITGEDNLEDISDTALPGLYKIAGDPICRITLLIKRINPGTRTLSAGIHLQVQAGSLS